VHGFVYLAIVNACLDILNLRCIKGMNYSVFMLASKIMQLTNLSLVQHCHQNYFMTSYLSLVVLLLMDQISYNNYTVPLVLLVFDPFVALVHL